MLCETPSPSAPRNDLPAAWNGVTGNGVAGCPIQRASATAASTPNGASTSATNQPDAVPTTRVPRRLSQVAPQISASASSQPSRGPSPGRDRKSTRLNSSHLVISYAVFCLKKKKQKLGS